MLNAAYLGVRTNKRMDAISIFLLIVLLATWLWLNALGTLAARYDGTLNPFQRKAQIIIVWLVPFLGASLILYLVAQHSPEAMPRKWVPWPFRSLVHGRDRERHKYRDENEDSGIDLALSQRRDEFSHGGGGMDGGSSND